LPFHLFLYVVSVLGYPEWRLTRVHWNKYIYNKVNKKAPCGALMSSHPEG